MFKLVAEEWPRWITLIPAQGDAPAVEGLFDRITRGMKRRAQREASGQLPELDEGQERDILDLADIGDVYTRSLIRQGLRDWRGVGDAHGKVLAFSPEALELFLDNDVLFDATDEAYVMPEVRREAEKNALSASPNGTGEAAMPANGTAISPATPRKRGGAKSAPTSKTNPAPRKAKKSGS